MRFVFSILAAMWLAPLLAQEDETPPERPAKPPVTLAFTPPDLEGLIVLGIFDEAGGIERTLRFEPGAPELIIDTNGYIVKWDGLDEAGKPCAAGRYSARGFVVGADVQVEGEAFYFNDWMAENQIPAQDASLCQWPDALGVALKTAAGIAYEQIGEAGTLSPVLDPMDWAKPRAARPGLEPSPIAWAAGREGTTWVIVEENGQHVVAQFGKGDKAPRRELRVPKDEPQPVEILASAREDAILLKEIGSGGVQRVRMLKRSDAAAEKDGRVIADWEVIFERTLQPCANFGVVDGKLVADAGTASQDDAISLSLVENALEPGKKPRLKLKAAAAPAGSALISPEGLKLVEISSKGSWNRFSFAGDENSATLYQGDGVVVEEFTIRNLGHIAAFDAGAFLLEPPAQ